ncbi:MAG: hypothetical protein GZ087_03415 [Flavobacterium sp.]|nr:hypothetical protein [Flavobacterium sp.]
MSKTKVYSGQSFLNKVVESTGSVENAFAMALLNGRSVSDLLTVGQELLVVRMTNKQVVNHFKEKRPATGLNAAQESVLIPKLGIGTMAIGTTFIVG